MKRSFFGLAAAGGLLACGLVWPAVGQAAQDPAENPTAYTALRLVGKTLGADAINRVVEVTGRNGKPQPTVWKIVLKDGEGSKEVEVVDGRIGAQRPLARPAVGAPIRLPDLNLDSSGAFEATDAQAKKVHVRFDSINYTLRTSDKTGKPLWSLDLFNESGASAGTMKIAAHSGAVVAMDGRIAAESAPVANKPVAAGTPAAKPTATPVRAEAHVTPTLKTTTTVITTDRPAPRRDTTNPPVTTATATVTTVQTAPVQTTVVDIPDASGPAAPPPPPEQSGGFFNPGRPDPGPYLADREPFAGPCRSGGGPIRPARWRVRPAVLHRPQRSGQRHPPGPSACQHAAGLIGDRSSELG